MATPQLDIPKGLTLDKLWEYFYASNDRFEREAAKREAEAARRQAELDLRFEREKAEREAEAARRQAEADKRQAEADKREAEAEKRRAEREREWAESREQWAETRKQWAETKEVWENADRRLKAINVEVGGMSNTFGAVIEHLVIPGVQKRFAELGYNLDKVYPRQKVADRDSKLVAEIDLLLANAETIIAIEVKAKPSVKDIEKQGIKLSVLREYLGDEGEGRAILGAMAGAVFGKDQKKAAHEAGLFAIVQSGDTMRIEIPQGFKPRQW